MIVALKCNSYTTTEDAVSAGSLEPAGAALGLSKKKRGEGQWAATQDSGPLSLRTCLRLLLKQNPSQVCALIVLLLGNKSSNPGEKVKFDCTANSSPEVTIIKLNDYIANNCHHKSVRLRSIFALNVQMPKPTST